MLRNVIHFDLTVSFTGRDPSNFDYRHLVKFVGISSFNLLNAELNPTCHLLALLGAHHIFHVSRIRVKYRTTYCGNSLTYS